MKKYIKSMIAAALAGCMLTSAGALVACGGNGDGGNGGNGGETEYVFEAEYTDLTGLVGLGPSGSTSGLNMIAESKEASNGAFVGSLGENSPLTFKFTSDKDGTAALKGIFGSNALASITWTPEEFGIIVNGTAVTYTGFGTEQGVNSVQNFKLRTIGTINIKKGENTIVLKPQNNKHLNGTVSAPSVDCLKLTTDAKLTFDAHEDNLY